MDSRLLRYFVAVADQGTVSAAAKVLHITQPALSRQIKQQENQLGLKLFHREGTRLALTSEGKQFLAAAREILQVHDRAESFASALSHGQMQTVSIAAPRTSLIDIVAPFVATFRPHDPTPEVSEIVVTSGLEQGIAAFDLIVAPQRPPTHAAHHTLASLPVWAYVHPEHPWALRKTVTLEELTEEPIIVVPQEHKSRRVFDAAVALSNLAPHKIVEASHGHVAQALASARRGAAVVTDDARFGLHPLKVITGNDSLQIHLYAAWRKDHHAAESLTSIAERLRTFCQARYERGDARPHVTNSTAGPNSAPNSRA